MDNVVGPPFNGSLLRVGEWVRVTAASRLPGFTPGDRGRVADVSANAPGGAVLFYYCLIEQPGRPRLAAFLPGEVEREG